MNESSPNDRDRLVPPLAVDPDEKRRHRIAGGAAFALNAVVIALFLLRPAPESARPETAIPVEVVTLAEAEPEPPPPPEPAKEANPTPELPPIPEDRPRTSGGDDPELAQGEPRPAEPAEPEPPAKPEAKPEPPAPKADTPETQSAALDPALFEDKQALDVPFEPPPVPPKAERETARTSGGRELNVNPSVFTGEGGGDPYLNAVRDRVIEHLIYPASDELVGVSGTAQYQVVLDRDGNLLKAELVRSAGNDLLDRAGLNGIKRAAPFDPLPDTITGARVGILVVLFMKPFS